MTAMLMVEAQSLSSEAVFYLAMFLLGALAALALFPKGGRSD